jgi:hypothetical protein
MLPTLSISMSSRTAALWALTLAVALVGCSLKTNEALLPSAEMFVPQDAMEKVVTSDLPWTQISFQVRRPWLKFAVDEDRISQAKIEGWGLCRPMSTDWDGYEDYAVTPPRYRRLRTYVLYRDGVLLQLIGIYDTPLETMGPGKSGEKPVQQGVVIVRKATAKEALQTAADFHLSCDLRGQGAGN